MNYPFAERTQHVHPSFVREILKVTGNPKVISFAGGLPNPAYFPVGPIAAATAKVMANSGEDALQYSTTEGYYPLRRFIADRYHKRFGFTVDPEEIIITNGSQQGLDLIGKVFLDKGDKVLLERPAYLGAIQAFEMYQPEFRTVPLLDDGADMGLLEQTMANENIKLFYTVASFQNPSGISYSEAKRQQLAEVFEGRDSILVEDDPYGELRFAGNSPKSIRNYLEGNVILLGSFSKIVSPGMRLGWICAKREIVDKLVIMKQGTDLHSNYLAQRIAYQFLADNDLDAHIETIKAAYKRQRDAMVRAVELYCPKEVTITRPDGGMFLWMTLPEGHSTTKLFEEALKANVAFVPGRAFYVDGSGENTMRLNFSNSDETRIEEGIKRLGEMLHKMIK